MTIAQAERFYKQDKKKYELEKNKEFLIWLDDRIKDGYKCFIKVEELQNLIDYIVNWYEIKYPERELEYNEGIKYINFENIKKISDVMDIEQLLYRLSNRQLYLIECGYRAKGWGQHPIYENGKKIGWERHIFMQINKRDQEEYRSPINETSYFVLRANQKTGIVDKNIELEEYIDSKEDIKLDELLLIFKEKYKNKLEFSELEQSIYNHNCDLELKNKILQLIALKLLYSRNTIPERGYERAKRFINEFNKKLNLTLQTTEIDEIINKENINTEPKRKETNKIKTLIKNINKKN